MEVACTAMHGAKKYKNDDINNKNKKSYVPYENYPKVRFERGQVE
jgi:hypothetical protein